jgi:hypothetical protein
MKLPVAVGMEQREIVEPVGAALGSPHDVMDIPPGIMGDHLVAGRTAALLPLPKLPDTTV